MDLSKIKVGNSYRNYKELCIDLGVEPMRGNTKAKHLRELQEAFITETDGHRLYIVGVASRKPDFNTPVNPNKLQDLAQAIILDILADCYLKTGESHTNFTSTELYYRLNMVNRNYATYREAHKELSENTGVQLQIIEDFFNTMNSRMNSIVHRALAALERKGAIVYQNVYVTANGVATEEQLSQLLANEERTLFDMGLENKQQLFEGNKWKEFFSRLSKLNEETLGTSYFYKTFQIGFTENSLEYGSKKLKLETQNYKALNELIRKKQKASVTNRIARIESGFSTSKADFKIMPFIKEYEEGMDLLIAKLIKRR